MSAPILSNNGQLCQQKMFFLAVLLAFLLATVLFLFYRREPAPTSIFAPLYNPLGQSTDAGGACEVIFDRMFEKLIDSYRKCLLDNLDKKSKWSDLHKVVPLCMGSVLWQMLDVRFLNNWDDVKLAILPGQLVSVKDLANATAVSTGFDCIEVTLGVGRDIESEKKLKALIPFCRFYGADPILESGKVFKEMGVYHELAVAAKAGVLTASVLEHGTYQNKDVKTITLADYLKNYIKVDHVDYLFMDNEGAEYGLFEQFQPGQPLEMSNIAICQISVEMHGPLANYKMNMSLYDDLIFKTINSTSYLPFWSAGPATHERSYYVNIRDKYCVKTFFTKRFCKG